MRLTFDEATEAFRREFATWLDDNAPTEADTTERSRSTADVPAWARAWQRTLFDELDELEAEAKNVPGGELKPRAGETVLDRVHQAMILFAAGRGVHGISRFGQAELHNPAEAVVIVYEKDGRFFHLKTHDPQIAQISQMQGCWRVRFRSPLRNLCNLQILLFIEAVSLP